MRTTGQLGGTGGQVTLYWGEKGLIISTRTELSQMYQILGAHATMCTLCKCVCLGFSEKTKLIMTHYEGV